MCRVIAYQSHPGAGSTRLGPLATDLIILLNNFNVRRLYDRGKHILLGSERTTEVANRAAPVYV